MQELLSAYSTPLSSLFLADCLNIIVELHVGGLLDDVVLGRKLSSLELPVLQLLRALSFFHMLLAHFHESFKLAIRLEKTNVLDHALLACLRLSFAHARGTVYTAGPLRHAILVQHLDKRIDHHVIIPVSSHRIFKGRLGPGLSLVLFHHVLS